MRTKSTYHRVMEIVGAVAMWIGLVLMVVGAIWFLVAAFQEGILWGLGVLLLPVVWIVFLVLHWGRAKDPFFLQLYGIAAVLLGALAFGASLPTPWR